jgi:putative ABC transport system permease protein
VRPWCWRIAQRAVRRHIPTDRLQPVLGDLLEDYQQIAVTRGRLRAEAWLLGEALSLASSYRNRPWKSRRGIVDTFAWDVGQAWRSIRARPAATVATIVVLALGVGLVSAMFALADPYTFRRLPYDRPADLHTLRVSARAPYVVPRVSEWQQRNDLFDGLSAWRAERPVSIASGGGPLSLHLTAVSDSYFDVLGVPVSLSPDWRPGGRDGETPVVLTSAASTRVFGTVRSSGELLLTDDRTRPRLRVVGVLPRSYLDPVSRAAEAFVPLIDRPVVSIVRTATGSQIDGLGLLVRATSGVTGDAIAAALSTAPRDARGQLRGPGIGVTATSVVSQLLARVRPVALGALAAGLLILVVSAANVSNLLLARGASRARELAAREALGARRQDIVRLAFVELLLVASAGVGASLVCAELALSAISLVIPAEYVSLGAPAVSGRVITFACLANLAIMIASAIPAWVAWRVRPVELFTRSTTYEARFVRVLRSTMLAAQTGVAVVLVVGAALLARSFVNLVTQDPGYEGGTFALRVSYPDGARAHLRQDLDETMARLERLPSVLRAGATTGFLVDSGTMAGVGPPFILDGARVHTAQRQVSTGFFEAAGLRLIAGRLPATPADHARAIVVSSSFAERCCAGRSPLGRVATTAGVSYEIVGVVKDIYSNALDQQPGATAFIPIGDEILPVVSYVAKVDAPGRDFALAMEKEVRAVNSGANVSGGATMRARLMRSVNDRSFATVLVVFFALAAMAVSSAGLAGVVGFVVARRTQEIAIRMAIGADVWRIRWLVTRQTVLAATLGAAIGFIVSAWLAQLIHAWLYGIAPADPLSFAAAGGLVVSIVIVAVWIPTRRAVRVSPTIALRLE